MTPEEFAELKAVMANAARAAVESTVRTTIRDCLQPLNERLEVIELSVGNAVGRLNAYVERQVSEMKETLAAIDRRVSKLEADSIPDTERPARPSDAE